MPRIGMRLLPLERKHAQKSDQAQIAEHAHRVGEIVRFDAGLHCGRFDRCFDDVKDGRRVDPRQRELAIECLRRLGGELVLLPGVGRIASRLARAALPVMRAREADGARDAGLELLEMRERGLGLLEEAQRDPSGQELRFGEFVAGGQAGIRRELIARCGSCRPSALRGS